MKPARPAVGAVLNRQQQAELAERWIRDDRLPAEFRRHLQSIRDWEADEAEIERAGEDRPQWSKP